MPDVQKVALDCEQFGAQGITVHPRPDERHIRYSDVELLKPLVTTEFNIEGYPSKSFIDLVTRIKPHQVTLVPDPPEAITSSAGWDTVTNHDFLVDVIAEDDAKMNRKQLKECLKNVQSIDNEVKGQLFSRSLISENPGYFLEKCL